MKECARRTFCTLLILAGVHSTGCSQVQVAARDQLVENLTPILEVEREVQKLSLVYQKLILIGWIDNVERQRLQQHYDIYYIYHKAAAVSLAQGDLQSYRSYVRLAGEELDGIESRMRFLVSINPD